MSNLKNKVILVTGGSGLIGKAIIKEIRKQKGIAINADINAETNSNNTEIYCDITNTKSVDDTIKKLIASFGKIDGLINNAYPRTKDWGSKFEDIPFKSWQNNVNWQLNSYFYLIQQVTEYFKKQNSGSIVNIASVYGMVGPDFSVYDNTNMTMPAAYSAIKGGIINFTKYMASYLGKYNIRVNAISPGGIFDNQNPTFVNNYNKKVPLKRMGEPKDIAPAVCFLLSNDSLYITGQNIAIDGGWTAI